MKTVEPVSQVPYLLPPAAFHHRIPVFQGKNRRPEGIAYLWKMVFIPQKLHQLFSEFRRSLCYELSCFMLIKDKINKLQKNLQLFPFRGKNLVNRKPFILGVFLRKN